MLKRAQTILQHEIQALRHLPLDNIEKAMSILLKCSGNVIFTGMGKAGLVAKKIAATFSSIGVSSFFLHPGEAQHGDLGLLKEQDMIVAFSNSGKTREVIECLVLAQAINQHKVIAVTSNTQTGLCKLADVTLALGEVEEVGPFGLVPTTSTTLMSVLGDILTVLLMEEKKLSQKQYSQFHHGGYIGSQMKLLHEEAS